MAISPRLLNELAPVEISLDLRLGFSQTSLESSRRFPAAANHPFPFRFARWTPGSYLLRDYVATLNPWRLAGHGFWRPPPLLPKPSCRVRGWPEPAGRLAWSSSAVEIVIGRAGHELQCCAPAISY